MENNRILILEDILIFTEKINLDKFKISNSVMRKKVCKRHEKFY